MPTLQSSTQSKTYLNKKAPNQAQKKSIACLT